MGTHLYLYLEVSETKHATATIAITMERISHHGPMAACCQVPRVSMLPRLDLTGQIGRGARPE